MLPAFTAALMLFYLSAIPIHIAVRLRIGHDNFFGVGISIFEPRFALRQTRKPRPFSGRTPSAFNRINKLDFLKSIFRHIRIEQLRLDGSFGSSNAALTALICGGASALGCALYGSAGQKVRISLRPDFTADALRAELSGMICVRAGHIMLAALLGAFQYGTRRIQKWTSIPSKAL